MDPNQQINNGQDDLNDALDFENNNELNLTNQEDNLNLDEDPETAKKIKQEYEKFMEEMKNLGVSNTGGDQGFQNLTNMLGGLLKNLTSEAGLEGEQNDISKGFQEMFKNLKQDNIEQAAGKLLNQFMDKSLLYEPMIEVKQHYEEYFKKQEGKLQKVEEQRYRNQYAVLSEIIKTLDNNSEQKEKLIGLFEKMQDYGNPPPGIASTTSFM